LIGLILKLFWSLLKGIIRSTCPLRSWRFLLCILLKITVDILWVIVLIWSWINIIDWISRIYKWITWHDLLFSPNFNLCVWIVNDTQSWISYLRHLNWSNFTLIVLYFFWIDDKTFLRILLLFLTNSFLSSFINLSNSLVSILVWRFLKYNKTILIYLNIGNIRDRKCVFWWLKNRLRNINFK